MTVRGALDKIMPECDIVAELTWEEGVAYADVSTTAITKVLAPIIERALRTSARKMQLIYDIPLTDKVAKEEVEQCVTAGIAAMVEEL